MRLITAFELATCSKKELAALFQQAAQAAIRSERGSANRRNALASMENIHRALQQKFRF